MSNTSLDASGTCRFVSDNLCLAQLCPAASTQSLWYRHPDMDKNPLSTVVIVFVIGDVYTTWHAIMRHSVSLLTVIAWIQCIGLVVLYLKNSGTYLFYSSAPIFPIYLGLKLAGITPPLKVPAVYVIASVAYLVVMFLLWQMKRNYDRFIARSETEPAA